MAKWGLFGAHRYLEAERGAGRTHGPDGRSLQRPWRVVREDTALLARRRREARPQPRWPRRLGVVLILIAVVNALHPVHPIPPHVAGSASARTGVVPSPLRTLSPLGAVDGAPTRFEWTGADRVSLVLCDAGYEPIARFDDLRGGSWDANRELRTLLAAARTFHWFVEVCADGRTVRSPFASCDIR